MLAVLLVVTFVFAVTDTRQPSFYASRIVGGRNSTIREFPYQISLEYHSSFTCGGSILSPYYVLTAAHCVHGRGSSDSFKVRAGSSLVGQGGSVHQVVNYTIHEKYYVNEFSNTGFDVAVLKLKEPIKYDKNRQPISLFEPDKESKPGVIATASGWGRLRHMGPLPKQLQSVKMVVVSKQECLELYQDLGGIQEGEICTTFTGNNVQSVCNGDSGGPLVINGKLAGIAAHAEECGNSKYPGVFTEVAHFRKWIDDRVEY